jgi:hypothetical protein
MSLSTIETKSAANTSSEDLEGSLTQPERLGSLAVEVQPTAQNLSLAEEQAQARDEILRDVETEDIGGY